MCSTPRQRIDLARRLNDSIVARAKRNPDRVRGFATLPLPDVEASLIELERIKDAPGVVGIGVGSNFDGVALDDLSLEPVWARIAELGLPVSEHPMLPTFAEHLPGYALPIRVGFPVRHHALRHPHDLWRRVRAASEAVVHRRAHRVGLHRPAGAARPRLPAVPRVPRAHHAAAERVRAQNLYYDTCAFSKSFIEMAVGEIGIDRFMFGTDYPYIISDPSYIEALGSSRRAEAEDLRRQCAAAVCATACALVRVLINPVL